ncbi:LacI family DNA-binding transcriptional regulator [Plantibacter sp. CFBP 8804]|nr:LacI family DNA-binding transcriptional regulator [Plantibacter sp. CFBP 8804]
MSYRTVSNVVNDRPHVRDATRVRVNEAIASVGYRPSYAGRSLRSGRTGIIRLAVPELGHPYFAGFASRVIEAANSRGLVVLTEQHGADRKRELQTLLGTGRQSTDGLLMSPASLLSSDVERLSPKSAVVILGQEWSPGHVDQVVMDDRGGAMKATNHLLTLGHERIAVLGGESLIYVRAANLRLAGYREALEQHGHRVDPALVVPAAMWHRPDGAEAIARLLAAGQRFSAVFALNDTLALGAMHELQRRGLRVPQDVAVVGFDNVAEGLYSNPSLSTVDPDWRSIAHLAVDTLISRIESPDSSHTTTHVTASLVQRASTEPVESLMTIRNDVSSR